MSEPFLGQIQTFAFGFAPRNWALCDGQTLPINQNQALFSLLGTIYGGDGRTTYGLPDLRGRTTLHFGTGDGLTPRTIGHRAGAEDVVLTTNQIPSHTHPSTLRARAEDGDVADPAGNLLASGTTIYGTGTPDTTLASDAISFPNAGGSAAHNNLQPYLVINYCIALDGVFPSRN